MSPAAAKLLMCVCAGGTGALVAPVAHRVIHATTRHAVHRSAPAVARPVAAVPCAPDGIASSALRGTVASLAPLETAPILPQSTDLAAHLATGSSPLEIVEGGGGFGYAGGGIGGGIGGGVGGGIGGGSGAGPGVGGGVVTLPGSSSAPEPQNWALMVAGFGTLGGALRATRRLAA